VGKLRFNWFRERPKVARYLVCILLISVAALILIINLVDKSSTGESAVSQIVFTTSSQEIELGIVSSVIILQTQDANGTACEVEDDTIITLFTSCSTGCFKNESMTITSVTIPKDLNSARFYYVDTAKGLPTIIASESPSQGWNDAAQQITVTGKKVYWGMEKVTGAAGHDIELINNPQAVNTSWSTLKAFLDRDQTEDRPYNVSTYHCADFAERLHNNAENEGIKAAFVCISFGAFQYGHACNAFETTDLGLIFIDDTGTWWGSSGDCIVNVSKWQAYIPRSIRTNYEYDSMGTIHDFTITW